jgi:hypothetical protein
MWRTPDASTTAMISEDDSKTTAAGSRYSA